jgi:uncharacterized membrane protein
MKNSHEPQFIIQPAPLGEKLALITGKRLITFHALLSIATTIGLLLAPYVWVPYVSAALIGSVLTSMTTFLLFMITDHEKHTWKEINYIVDRVNESTQTVTIEELVKNDEKNDI